MKKIIFAMGLALIPGQLCAAEAPAALEALKALASVAALPEFASGIKLRPAPAPTLAWDYPNDLLQYTGSWNFELKDRKYAIKLGFRQGTYDSYAKTFKARPILTLIRDVSDTEGEGFVNFTRLVYLDELESEGLISFYADNNDYLSISKTAGKLTAQDCNLDTEKCEDISTVNIRELYTAWGKTAEAFPALVGERKIYAMPQLFFEDVIKYGYVVTERSPFYYTTGAPQDFVELFRKDGEGNMSFRPKAYSLVLGLTFELKSSEYPQTWTVREILESEVQDAINESLANRGKAGAIAAAGQASATVKAGK